MSIKKLEYVYVKYNGVFSDPWTHGSDTRWTDVGTFIASIKWRESVILRHTLIG